MKQDIRFTTFLALATVLILWASAFAGIRLALRDFSAGNLAFLRYGIASLVLVIIAFWQRVRLPDMTDVPRIALSGFLGVAVYNVALNFGQTTVRAGAASFIVNTIPIFTALLSMFFLRDNLRPFVIIGMFMSFCGVALIALGEGQGIEINRGAFFILGAAICWSLATILQKPLLVKYRAFEVVCYAIWTGTACMFFYLPGTIEQVGRAGSDTMMTIYYLGIFPAALAYICWAVVLSNMTAARASAFLYLVPPISALIALVWLGEILTLKTLVGGSLALGGVIVVNTLGRPQKLRA